MNVNKKIMTFYDTIRQYNWQEITESIQSKTLEDAREALAAPRRTLEHFQALISPAATPLLEDMAREANRLTRERFGDTIQLYIPLYLSNYCTNFCVYCGFNHDNDIHRKKLTLEEVLAERAVIEKWGFRHILLVSGEAPLVANVDYYEEVIRAIRDRFSQIAIEVQPMNTEDYARLREAGLGYVCVYQETYNEAAYPSYHPAGRKANYRYRLETGDRVCQAGVHKMGIGALLGLENWRTDAFFTALHLRYLERTYWQTRYSISLPRLRPHAGAFMPKDPITDRQLVQLICAYRLLDPEVEITISTREGREFRDHLMHLGATSMSAGSSTEPGGYVTPHKELEQFAINDDRTPEEMVAAIKAQGLEPVWKDWAPWM